MAAKMAVRAGACSVRGSWRTFLKWHLRSGRHHGLHRRSSVVLPVFSALTSPTQPLSKVLRCGHFVPVATAWARMYNSGGASQVDTVVLILLQFPCRIGVSANARARRRSRSVHLHQFDGLPTAVRLAFSAGRDC